MQLQPLVMWPSIQHFLCRGSVYIQNIVIIWCLVNLLDKVLISHLRTIYLEQENIKKVKKNISMLSSVGTVDIQFCIAQRLDLL